MTAQAAWQMRLLECVQWAAWRITGDLNLSGDGTSATPFETFHELDDVAKSGHLEKSPWCAAATAGVLRRVPDA